VSRIRSCKVVNTGGRNGVKGWDSGEWENGTRVWFAHSAGSQYVMLTLWLRGVDGATAVRSILAAVEISVAWTLDS